VNIVDEPAAISGYLPGRHRLTVQAHDTPDGTVCDQVIATPSFVLTLPVATGHHLKNMPSLICSSVAGVRMCLQVGHTCRDYSPLAKRRATCEILTL
jgi:hypothetical protein